MNRTKQEGKVEDEKRISSEKQSQSERLHANAQRLIHEQSDLARITTFGRRDE